MSSAPARQAPSRPGIGVSGLVGSAVVFSVFTNLLMLTGPLFMLQIYDRVLRSRSEETLVALFGLVAMLYGFYWLLEYARGRVMARVGVRLHERLGDRVFQATLDRAALHSGPRAGSLQDLETVRAIFGTPVLLALLDAPWTPLFLLAIFIFHPMLGWLALAGGGVLIGIAILNQVLTQKRTVRAVQLSEAANRFGTQTEKGAELIRAQGMGGAMMRRWLRLQDAAVQQGLVANDRTGSFSAFTRGFRLFLQSAMLALGAWLVLQQQLTAGAMIAASILLGRALAPIDVAVAQWQLIQRARRSWQSLRRLLAEVPAPAAPTELPAPAGRIAVRNLSLLIRRGEAPVLSGVSFDVAPGEALGIIGRSGSGKTTLARILVGLTPPSGGEVRIDGATHAQYGPDRLGHYIGYLPQNVQLFDGTVAENLAQMIESPDPDKVVAAARKARVHEIILGLPDGYDTLIAADDNRLSGGQKQRLALARALYNDPVILVLDEPNSALDAEGSEALNATIAAMKSDGRAVLVMTHRPTAISACDKLLVLDQGRVKGYGPRDEIIRSMLQNAAEVEKVVRGPGQT